MWSSRSSFGSTQSSEALAGITPDLNSCVRPLTWKMQAPPFAWPVSVFWEITNSGLPFVRPMACASVLCSSDSFGSFALVDVSCLETTAMSSGVTPSAARSCTSFESRPPRPAARAPRPGAGIEVCAPSAYEWMKPTTPATGRPMRSAMSPRASRIVPPPWDSRKPPRRRSFAREKKRASMPFAYISSELAVAFMLPKPITDSTPMSSIAPVTTKSALPRAILSAPSSSDTAAVAQAETG